MGKSNFSEQYTKLINRYKRIGYSLDIMRQTACPVINPIIIDDYASLFGLARRGSVIGFHLFCHTVELAMSTRLCLS